VLTSGSALTFDGTNLGVGVSSPSAPLDIQSNSGGTGIRVIGRASANAGAIRYFANDNTTQRARIESNDTGLEINSVANLPTYFLVNDTEQMRLTSTGLGIGTSSPDYKLDVNGTSNFSGNMNLTATSNINWNGGDVAISNSGTNLVFKTYSGSLAERARLDSSGNLGLGVTPSAWGAGTSVIDLATSGSAGAVSSSGTLSLANNGFFNGTNWIYKNTSSALLYQLISNEHRWSVAASGTAGNAISFTQAMTLDASGNLSVGGTSAKGQITSIKSSSTTTFSSLGHGMLGLQNTSSTNNNYTWMNFYESNGNYVGAIGTLNEVHSSASTTVKGSLVFATKQSGVGGYPVERARITSVGDLLVSSTVAGAGVGDTNTGITLGAADYISASRSNNTAAFFNRNDSDGVIVNLRKGGSDIGGMGSYVPSGTGYNAPFIGGTFSAISFASNAIWPIVSHTNTAKDDGGIDLGAADARFKDLYLSGGVYVGGTAAANKLDDYEEGTFTVFARDEDNNAQTYYESPGQYNRGHYVKIGQYVYFTIQMYTSGSGSTVGTQAVKITGLPFTAATVGGNGNVGSCTFPYFSDSSGGVGVFVGSVTEGGTSIYIQKTDTNGVTSAATITNWSTPRLSAVGWYRAAA
jgi:hypothetical protein